MTFRQFEYWARQRPDAPALVAAGRPTWTYAPALRAVNAIARRLVDSGVRAGDVVALPLSNAGGLFCQFALDRIGACGAVLPEPAPWMPWVIKLSPSEAPRAIHIPEPEAPDVFQGWDDDLPMPPHLWGPDEPYQVKTSSGSTGRPKLIQRGYQSTLASMEGNRTMMGLGPGVVCAHALAFAGPAIGLKTNAWTSGATLAMPAPGLAALFDDVEQLKVDVLAISPSTTQSALQVAPPRRPLPRLTICFFGARAAKPLLERVTAEVTPRLVMTYGSTETGACLAAFLQERPLTGATYGFVSPQALLEVVGADGRAAADSETGRIRLGVHSPGVDGYLDDKGRYLPFDAKDPSWFYPGDSGRIDADGMVHVLGRDDDVVNLGGRKLRTADVDEAVHASGLTIEHATLNAQDAAGATWVVVAVVLRHGMKVAEVRGAIKTAMPFASGFRLMRMKTLPRLPNTKVDFIALRKHFLEVNEKLAQAGDTA